MTVQKYLDHITSNHHIRPKFMKWLEDNLTIVDHTYLMLRMLDSDFDIDNAIGKQLDTIGTIVGRSRILNFEVDGIKPVLDDETYRIILLAKVKMNMWDGTVEQIYDIFESIFEDIYLELEDKQDMSYNAYITGYINKVRQLLIQNRLILPKPEGVRVNYIGKSKMNFHSYLGMGVYVLKRETARFDFNYDPIVPFGQYPYFVVSGRKVEFLVAINERKEKIKVDAYLHMYVKGTKVYKVDLVEPILMRYKTWERLECRAFSNMYVKEDKISKLKQELKGDEVNGNI